MKPNIPYSDKRILICPLDWGLGHASRCVPLIKQLQAQNNQVVVACTDWQKTFLQNEIEGVAYTALFGYNVKYSKSISLGAKLFLQSLRISFIIKKERSWLKEFLTHNKIDVVISDNRFGLYNKNVESVFITHQLFVPAPFLSGMVNKINRYYIKKYNACWVPDFEEEENSLTGKLAHGDSKLKQINYIGPLSRFTRSASTSEKKYDVLILLSGVEPQRTLLEEKLTEAFAGTNFKIALVRGIESDIQKQFPGNFSIFNTANTKELEGLFLTSHEIICRSGYSTLMDLRALGLKALLVPTPGQTEQEYLAQYWHEKFRFNCIAQNNINTEDIVTLLGLKENFVLQKQSV